MTEKHAYEIFLGRRHIGIIVSESPKEAVESAFAKEGYAIDTNGIVKTSVNNANAHAFLKRKVRNRTELVSENHYRVPVLGKIYPVITIKKVPGEKLAIRVTKASDIPRFLRRNIAVTGGTVHLHSLEGIEAVPLENSPVIAYEKIDTSKVSNDNKLPRSIDGSVYNVWWQRNAAEVLIEKNGKFYNKADGKPGCKAQLVNGVPPRFLGGIRAHSLQRGDNGWFFRVAWQSPEDPALFATDNKGFWVKYGDGDFNFLEMGTPSADAYALYDDETRRYTMSLNEYYARLCGK